VRPEGFENVATVLVDPAVIEDLELDLMARDMRLWAVHQVGTFPDPRRLAFQLRRSMIDASNGCWAEAADWTVVWISFGDSWRDGDEPLPWSAHAALWEKLGEYTGHVHYSLGLGGVPYLDVPREHT
jgi:hypothetical protein